MRQAQKAMEPAFDQTTERIDSKPMRIDILTLFPEMCDTVLRESIIGRARERGLVELNCRNIRDYTLDKHNRVDDTPYGGGMGMVMQTQPIYDCFQALCGEVGRKPHFIYLSPQGKVLTQNRVREGSREAEAYRNGENNMLLFVRQQVEHPDYGCRMGFTYLGQVTMKSIEGSKPMQIVWHLNTPMSEATYAFASQYKAIG